MKKATYLEGVKCCEELYRSFDYNFVQLECYLSEEESYLDYRWGKWIDGFSDTIEHFKYFKHLLVL